jgi:hypothetical protein
MEIPSKDSILKTSVFYFDCKEAHERYALKFLGAKVDNMRKMWEKKMKIEQLKMDIYKLALSDVLEMLEDKK